jgi:hypothetical protein
MLADLDDPERAELTRVLRALLARLS